MKTTFFIPRILRAKHAFVPPRPWIDIHAHVLPGIDDGPRTWEDALALVKEAEEVGVTHIVATPHYSDMFAADTDVICSLCDELNTRLRERNSAVDVIPGREVSFTDTHIDALQADPSLHSPMHSHTLLIELPEGINAETILKGLFTLMLQETSVVIAHPERASLIQSDPSFARQLRERGAYIQIDAGSVMGRNGAKARATARRLIKNETVDILSSDAHRPGDYLTYLRACTWAHNVLPEDALSAMLCTRPARLINYTLHSN